MPEFAYRCLDASGEVETGKLDALDLAAASEELYRRGLTPLDISDGGPTFAMRLNEPITFFAKAKPRDIHAFLRDLGRLLKAGLSVDDGLKLVINMQTRELFIKQLEDVLEQVRSGESLATALSKYPDEFPVQTVAAVQAGEVSGSLPATLEAIAHSMDKALSFRERIKSALIYPSILVAMVCATFVLVITFVLPQFEPLFKGNEDKLPFATRMLMDMGDFFADYWILVGLGFLAAIFWLLSVMKRPGKRALWYERLCSIKWFRSWLLEPDTIRFIRTVGVCTNSGLALDKAISMGIDAVKMDHVREELALIHIDVRRGVLFSEALKNITWLPILVLHFAKVGEQSGKLGDMLEESSGLMAGEYETRLEKAVDVMTPLLTLLMGGIVALLVGSVLLGIMSINDVALG
ncbi:type II secretion system F family protein [Kordiimonas sp. SCSIO 12603]|uniref:type II secretion system F family protein n=1 Tax=Kordiimonas sp. SCSIO 12603 TaxID=2829596 RepID=UPI00210811A8|nr:type II secretion system F family protein [Kordiimonas sp. SCSIO 12603]UTW58739.1 type II secretion system F family protein [Kordiimonas sp. SCSIO 12603]